MTADLDALLDALDAADTAVREIYRRLAMAPDLAPEHEAELGELHAKRNELARQVGMAALTQRRTRRSSREIVDAAPEAAPAEPAPITSASGAPSSTIALVRETRGALEMIANGRSSVVATAPELAAPAPQPGPDPGALPTELLSPAGPPQSAPPPTSSHPIPPAPASDAQVAAFKSAVQSKGLGMPIAPLPSVTPATSAPRPWPVTLHEMMCLLGPRETYLDDPAALVDELDALEQVATPERQVQWVRFPIEVQKHWLSHLVARTRAMRDHPSSEGILDRLKKIRAVYPQWAREYVPGHINGLQLKHAPIGAAWADDADDHWGALLAVVGHEIPTARKVPPARKKKERLAVEDEPTIVAADWPLLPLVRGKVALIVGGAPKEPNRDRLETYLRLATLEWPDIDGPRKVEAIAQRVAKGAYDLVLVVTTLISHPEAERVLDAARQSRVRWAMVEGYGVAAVVQGLERFIKPAKPAG